MPNPFGSEPRSDSAFGLGSGLGAGFGSALGSGFLPNPFGSEPRSDSAFGSGLGAGFAACFGAGFAACFGAGFAKLDESFSSFASSTAILSSRSFLVCLLGDFVAIEGPAGGSFIYFLVGTAGFHA